VKKIGFYILLVVLLCSSCQLKWKPFNDDLSEPKLEIQRYDRLESRYFTTGDYSALQQMNTDYPIETRTLIEKMLQLGEIYDPNMRQKFLIYFQDSTLQSMIADVETEYANMDDLNEELKNAFDNLEDWIPDIPKPIFYSQIGALTQSVVVGDKSVGVSLDKYLGINYPLYKKNYPFSQRKTMTRAYVVPDCISFYLLSLYPLKNADRRSRWDSDIHMGKLMWITNKAVEKSIYDTPYVRSVNHYMKKHRKLTILDLLKMNDYSKMR
jgi:hypothetical protein